MQAGFDERKRGFKRVGGAWCVWVGLDVCVYLKVAGYNTNRLLADIAIEWRFGHNL